MRLFNTLRTHHHRLYTEKIAAGPPLTAMPSSIMLYRGGGLSRVQRHHIRSCSASNGAIRGTPLHHPAAHALRRSVGRHAVELRAASQGVGNGSSSQEQCDVAGLTKAAAMAIVLTTIAQAGEARAEGEPWRPRRHHRHMGERITPTWAEEAVEVCAGSTSGSFEFGHVSRMLAPIKLT